MTKHRRTVIHTFAAALAFLAALISLPAFAAPAAKECDVHLAVDFANIQGDLVNFWNASGLAMDYTKPVQHQNMQLIGSIPYQGCLYQRPHSLLNLVHVTGWETDAPRYDWTALDTYLDVIIQSGQRMFFEIMGNPDKHFSDFHDPRQVLEWKILVRDMALHFIDRYGRPEVRRWYFETWNEPDGDYRWEWDHEEFMNYYDACSQGLIEADPGLVFGGPGVANYKSDYVDKLVEHYAEGTNRLTGQKGVRLDYISFHMKEDPADQVIRELRLINRLLERWPHLHSIPFINNEADSECCWKDKDKEYRATSWYAAYIARQVNEHIHHHILAHGRVVRLANDNAFLGDWIHRTHFTWFGDGEKFALIKKPAHNVMIMLSLLGDRLCEVSGYNLTDDIGAVATRDAAGRLAVLVYSFQKDDSARGRSTVVVEFNNLPFERGKLIEYRIDEDHTNPYEIWQQCGSPETPNPDDLRKMQAVHELAPVRGPEDAYRRGAVALDLPLHAVALLVLNPDPGRAPAQPQNLRARQYRSLFDGTEQVTLRWDSLSKDILTYEVLFSEDPAGPFTRLNTDHILCTAWTHERPENASGWYKVRAVDYWNRTGPETPLLCVK